MIFCHRRGASAFLCYDTTREVEDAEDGETEASDSAAAIDIKSDEDNQEKILVLNNISRKTVSLS